MATNAKLGRGTLVQVQLSGVWTTIPEARQVDGPNIQGSQVDVSNFDSAGRTKEFIAGLVDPGTLDFECNLDLSNAVHNQLFDDLISAGSGSSITRSYRLKFPQYTPAQTRTFSAFVNSGPYAIPDGSQMTVRFQLQISGTITRGTE